MEEVVEEETQTVQSAAGLYTGCSTLIVTPDVLGLFSYIFLMISGLFFFWDGLWQEGKYTTPQQKAVEQWLVWFRPFPLQAG